MNPLSLTRRALIGALSALPILGTARVAESIEAAPAPSGDPLPSWNEGRARQGVLDFVKATTDRASPDYVPPADRIAVFDQDGTLWVEHPLYTQAAFALDRLKQLAPGHEAWKRLEPFKAVLSGDEEAIARLSEAAWTEIIGVTHTGMTTDEFLHIVAGWLETARHPRFNRPYASLVYQPMLEVMEHLRANGFRTYIATGGGQEFVRAYGEQVYGVPPEQAIGSSFETKYEMTDGAPSLMRLPRMFFVNNYQGKAIGLNLFIGRRPHAAFGNSSGDRQMLEWTGAGKGKRLNMLVHHDDGEREYAYGPAGGLPGTKIGEFPDDLMTEAGERGWIVISMKNDWKRIFAPDDVL